MTKLNLAQLCWRVVDDCCGENLRKSYGYPEANES
ncbi:hypothetical protein YSA_p00147 (plasmid) [Pseudomonas putida ND6]|uniref:Uncharacterized protein n=2 Tax=Gammaproteobacteria TaxID=1236 RepID=A0A890DEH3_ECOLX|nr:hypothetical protein YSA_p00147 [Pseudomonas putida ND6]QRG42609.1 hypothetical protein [Escherichia coli]UVN18757.1 Hypothetical protein [Pseudomonas aeruginosa]UVN19059.1 hypothetical protein [Pseudomonas aeruginosa]